MRVLRPMAEAVLEASCLAAVALVPLCLDRQASFMFEPPKAALLQAIAVVALVSWAIVGLCPAGTNSSVAARWPANFAQLARTPSIAAIGLVLFTSALATALSISPAQSLWGLPGRARGLLTLAAAVSLFAATLSRLSSPQFLRMLVSVLILPSIPLAVYALAERLGFEVLAVTWRETVARRAMSLFGEPVFLAAYLDLVLPFTVARAFEGWRGSGTRRARRWAATGYAVAAALQMAAALASESRGALLGLIVAGGLALLAASARRGWRRPVIALWSITAFAAIAIALGVPAKLARMHQAPESSVAERAAAAFEVQSSSAAFRRATWTSAERILHRREALELVDASRDGLAPLRLFVGYGPETLAAVAPVSYHASLVPSYQYTLMDRSHNQLWDELITTGVLGLGAWLALQSALLWLAVSGLGLTVSPARAKAFWFTYAGGAGAGALLGSALQGVAFCFLGLQLGAALGLGLFLSAAALQGVATTQARETAAPGQRHEGLLIAGMTALVAHVLEVSFSFQVITTTALFFVVCALLIACGKDRIAAETEPKHGALRASAASVRDALFDAALLTWIVAALSFALVGASSFSPRIGRVVWDSLTLVGRPAGVRAPVVAVVMASAWLGGGLLLLSERARVGNTTLTRHARVMLAAALAFSCASFLVFAATRTELPIPLISKAQLVPGGLEICHHGWQAFLATSALLLALLAITRTRIAASSRAPTWPRALCACLCVVLGLASIVRLGLRPVQADEAIPIGNWLATGQFAMAAAVYEYADALSPELGVGQAWLAKAERRRADVEPDSSADAIDRAYDALRSSVARNPAAIEHAALLAQLLAMRAALATTPEARTERLAEVSEAFARAIRLHPLSAPVLLSWAEVQLLLFRDPQAALQSARRIPAQRRQTASYHALVGQALLALAQSQPNATQHRIAAAAEYTHAGALEPGQPGHYVLAGQLYLEAGMPELATKSLRQALAALAPTAPERATLLQLLERARSEVAVVRQVPGPAP